MTLLEEFDANVIWQWHNNTRSVGEALAAAGSGNFGYALSLLQSGQGHNPHVQEVYQNAVNQYGNSAIFNRVAQTTDRGPDFNEMKVNTDWQFTNNLQSLVDAK